MGGEAARELGRPPVSRRSATASGPRAFCILSSAVLIRLSRVKPNPVPDNLHIYLPHHPKAPTELLSDRRRYRA